MEENLSGSEMSRKVIMVRKNLDDIPFFSPPPGFSLRWYQPGDRENWLRIHKMAEPSMEVTPALYDSQFGNDEQMLAQRQVFMLSEDGTAVGTATAWFSRHFKTPGCGRVHWVAVLPQFQRRGLARVLVSVVCNRLRDLGCSRAYLVTWSGRPWAIRLYERLGFAQEDDAEPRRG